MRLILRPGCHVLKRGDGGVQVRLDPSRAVVLPDTDRVRAALRLLNRPADDDTEMDPTTLALLAANDLLMDEAALMPLIPVTGSGRGPSRGSVAALALTVGDGTPQAVELRAACKVELAPFGGPLSGPLVSEMGGMLAASGMSMVAPRRRTSGEFTPRTHVGALVGVGEPRRDLVDGWIRAGTPHMLVRLVEGDAVVGPFVVPGKTACLRCLDAHRTDDDPSWPLLVAQYAATSGRDRPDGAPEPVDALLSSIALAWAARDLTSYAEGRLPSTWSATLRLDPHLSAVENRSWLRHPACGCGWG